MKTCSKCNMSGIPDDAKFCPKCGAALTDAPSPWREKYKELKEHLEELQNEKRQWTLFDNDRQKMLTVLQQDSDFESAIKENIEIIRYNRNTLPKKKVWIRLIGWSLIFFCVVLFVVCITRSDEMLKIIPWWLFTIITLGDCALLPIGIIVLLSVTSEKLLIYNRYITNFYEPFIEKHMSDYEWIVALPVNTEKILEIEIYEPETISNGIARRMEELDKKIEDWEKQIKIIHEIQ